MAMVIADTALRQHTQLSAARIAEEEGFVRVVYMAFYEGTLAPGSDHFRAMIDHHRFEGVDLWKTRPWEILMQERRLEMRRR